MAYLRESKSAAVRARLSHPVIDGDGHWLPRIGDGQSLPFEF